MQNIIVSKFDHFVNMPLRSNKKKIAIKRNISSFHKEYLEKKQSLEFTEALFSQIDEKLSPYEKKVRLSDLCIEHKKIFALMQYWLRLLECAKNDLFLFELMENKK